MCVYRASPLITFLLQLLYIVYYVVQIKNKTTVSRIIIKAVYCVCHTEFFLTYCTGNARGGVLQCVLCVQRYYKAQ